ncbi:MAG TPA: aldo/keto reductase [Terriglobales bacterium]|jgi:aryl-alcohol dehydrogenase-like predicted oxidoreductase
MKKRRIGSLEVSEVGVGCNNFGWRLDAAATALVVDAALDSGINFFDTADIYGKGTSEEYLGKALGPRRKQVIVATKFGMAMDGERRGAKPVYMRQAAEDSLRRLGTDYIDLYQLHQPDSTTPIADTLGALDQLVKEGKVREIGCSNFSADQIREAVGAAKLGYAGFESVQNQYSLLHREPEDYVLPECERLVLAFLPYFPLANGLLTGKYRKGQPPPGGTRLAPGERHGGLLSDQNLSLVESLIFYAEHKDRSLLELSISWLASHVVVASVIAGATKPEQVRANARAAGWRMTEEEMNEIDTILTRFRLRKAS